MTERHIQDICVPESLIKFFENNNKVALAFSGGVDSAYLLYAAKACGCDIHAYYAKTAFQPEFELRDARRLAEELGAVMTVEENDILDIPEVRENPGNRCYFCKRALFAHLMEKAANDGYTLMIDGTNASDDASDRPGMRALRELEVRSPLRECGITKKVVREYSRKAGLFTWDKPAYACLATRVPAGTLITEECLNCVEKAEEALLELGFTDFRVRIFEGAARLQLPADQMIRALSMRGDILKALEPYFSIVLMDLRER